MSTEWIDHPQENCINCGHASDCSTHNEPALPAGPCDCPKSERHPDEYTCIVVNDEATTLPPGAKIQVVIETSSWEDFEEKLAYLASIEIPGLGEVTISNPAYVGSVFASRLSEDSKLFFEVKAPREEQIIPAVDPALARAKEVLTRVLDA